MARGINFEHDPETCPFCSPEDFVTFIFAKPDRINNYGHEVVEGEVISNEPERGSLKAIDWKQGDDAV